MRTYQLRKDDYSNTWYVVMWNDDRIVTDFGEYESKDAARDGANGDSLERDNVAAVFRGESEAPKVIREADDGTSYTTVKVYPKGTTDDVIKQDFPGWEGYSPCSPYDCTAEWCSSRLSITRKGSRVVASQSHYMDI